MWILLVAGCGSAEMEPVAVDGQHFRYVESGAAFVPWGFNYDHDDRDRLIEEYWDAEWPAVTSDFAEMRALGANVVRVHLQVGAFMRGPDEPDEAALERLGRLVELAESERLYLDLTGLGCYRAEDVPAWYDALGEEERWGAQARFWSAIAERVGASPAIFTYDLMNEPVVPAGPTDDWLPGEPLGGFSYVQNITREPGGRPAGDIMRSWIRTLTSAIREHDETHAITVGFLPFATYAELASELDHVSVHVYPRAGEIDASLELLEDLSVGRPVVVEETFLLESGADGLRDFLVRSRERDLAAGWLGFYWGTPPDELDPRDIRDAIVGQWLELFQELDPDG